MISSTWKGRDMRIIDIIRHLPDEELAEYLMDIAFENSKTSDALRFPSPLGGYLTRELDYLQDSDTLLDALIQEEGEDDEN